MQCLWLYAMWLRMAKMQQFLLPGVLTRSCLTINLFWLVNCCGFAWDKNTVEIQFKN